MSTAERTTSQHPTAARVRFHRPGHPQDRLRSRAGRAAPNRPDLVERAAIGTGGFADGGYWVVSKHKDVKEVSLRSDVFSSLQTPRCHATKTARPESSSRRASSSC